eukprot:6190737-Pleurochrysis_carterae.AAC.4
MATAADALEGASTPTHHLPGRHTLSATGVQAPRARQCLCEEVVEVATTPHNRAGRDSAAASETATPTSLCGSGKKCRIGGAPSGLGAPFPRSL